jgi:hypothetical protein
VIAARYVDADGDVLTVESAGDGVVVTISTDGGDTYVSVLLTLAQWAHLRAL